MDCFGTSFLAMTVRFVMESKRILIGEITTAHGIKGFVKLRVYAEDAMLIERLPVYTEDGKTIALKLKNAIKGDFIAEIKEIADRNMAEELRGTKLYIDRTSLPAADEGEYYAEDLTGLRVMDEAGKEIGSVLSIQNFGASDLLDIKPPSGGPNFYIPFTKDTLLDVDLEEGTITVAVPEVM